MKSPILTWQVIFGDNSWSYSILDNSFRWIWFLNTNILLHIWLKLEILQCDLFLHFYFISNLKLFHIYILENLEILFFVLEEFLSRYIHIKLKLIRGLTSFNFFRWISMRIYHWNRILENLIRIAMHEIILYLRIVLYPSFIFYLSKNKWIVIKKFFYTLYKFLKLENLMMIFLSIIILKVTIIQSIINELKFERVCGLWANLRDKNKLNFSVFDLCISSFNNALAFFFFANIYYEIQRRWKFCKVSNNLSNWTSGRSIQLHELWNWMLIDNKRSEEKKSFFMWKNSNREIVCCSWTFRTLTLHVFNIRNFFASKTSAYQLKLYSVFSFFFLYSRQRKKLIS